ncbi:MAG: hypothetical protein COU06_00860 [Candidatus Harrisonbacteria bacterium CG10_big_fil_rev_8_21_14_0_10_38_8]|uniref:Uncharacterized protein n=1 Tax=Candidatus Harrisonbacteria bacterium CG10_big_fil_rev_8_21_14_0_10_38_8 TaxID=1974582 RepID=A0A2M6WKG4_9BACT|nr:MAG: hypothetical protein COU06_00860 [Candidatus Harrisonbacteria bacterium CG10_big_fil_rev_8_21_14_0_10_38_8]
MLDFLSGTDNIILTGLKSFLIGIAPVVFFFIFVPFVRSLWIYWRQRTFEHSLEWAYLELKIPRVIEKNARGMDQVFKSIHTLINKAGDLGERYLLGEVTVWYTFELVSFSGDIHLYMRVFKPQKRMVEAAIFAFYPDIEVIEIEDYTKDLPNNVADMDAMGLDIWGTEMILAKDDVLPIKTYMDFEKSGDESKLDPISVFIEALGKAHSGEFVSLQFNCAPELPGWGDKYGDLIKKMKIPGVEEFKSPSGDVRPITIGKTKQENDIIQAVEKNIAEPGFKTLIRLLYIAPKDIWEEDFPRRVLRGLFNQYGQGDMNSFVDLERVTTRVTNWNFPFIFRKSRVRARQQRLLQMYIERDIEIEMFMGKLLTSHVFHWNFHAREIILNSTALATLFHPPTDLTLTGPHIQRMESKKMGAPAGLPIYADEKVLDRFINEK